MSDYQEIRERLSDGTEQTFYVVKLWRQNVLVLTQAELERGLRRGKWYRRRQVERARAIREERENARTNESRPDPG